MTEANDNQVYLGKVGLSQIRQVGSAYQEHFLRVLKQITTSTET
jgi:hypothetical protein